MNLQEWVARLDKAAKAAELTRLGKAARVSRETVRKAANGLAVGTYLRAKRLAAATGGSVTIEELCEPVLAKRRPR